MKLSILHQIIITLKSEHHEPFIQRITRNKILSKLLSLNLLIMQESASHFSEMKKIQRTILTTELQPLLQANPKVWYPLKRKLERISVRSSFATWIYEY